MRPNHYMKGSLFIYMADFFSPVSERQHNDIQDALSKLVNGLQPDSTSTSGNAVLNGNVTFKGSTTLQGGDVIQANSANAFAVGQNGTTTPALNVDTTTASSTTGLNIKSAANGSNVTVTVTSGQANDGVIFTPKGTGKFQIIPGSNNTFTFAVSNAAANSNYLVVDTLTPLVNIGTQLQIYTNNALALTVGPNGNTNPVVTVDNSVASQATGLKIQGQVVTGGILLAVTSSGAAEAMIIQAKNSSNSITINDTLAAATSPLLAGIATDTITGTVADGFTGALRLSPTINAATAQTVARYNYIDLVNPVLGGAGPAAVTDAAVFRFGAAAGTHKAVDSGTTKTTPTAVTQWVKINVNGTIGYIPSYSSKTS